MLEQGGLIDRRRFKRVKLGLPVRLKIISKGEPVVHDGRIINISGGGALVLCGNPLKAGQRVGLSIKFANREMLDALGVEQAEYGSEVTMNTLAEVCRPPQITLQDQGHLIPVKFLGHFRVNSID